MIKRKLSYMNIPKHHPDHPEYIPFLHRGLLDIDYDVLIAIIRNNEKRIEELLSRKDFKLSEYKALNGLRLVHEKVCRVRQMAYPC